MMAKQRFFTTRRGGQIRTDDLLVPNQARYRATLRPETLIEGAKILIELLRASFEESTCDPGWIRTSDLLLRRQLLYPTELRDQTTPAAPKAHAMASSGRPILLSNLRIFSSKQLSRSQP